MQVILISGKAQNGKDTVANILKELLEERGGRVLITHYADLLKYICRTFFGWNGEKDVYGRELLQYVGTDIVRKKCPDLWVDFIIQILTLFGDSWDYVIIPDCRFPNEVLKVKDSGIPTTLVRVVRENYSSNLTATQQHHPSEVALDDFVPDSYINNPGTGITELEPIVNNWLMENLL